MRKEHVYFVYIMSNNSPRLYTGVTHSIHRRVYEHKHKLVPGFNSQYSFDTLVYYEPFSDIRTAIAAKSRSRAGHGQRRWH